MFEGVTCEIQTPLCRGKPDRGKQHIEIRGDSTQPNGVVSNEYRNERNKAKKYVDEITIIKLLIYRNVLMSTV